MRSDNPRPGEERDGCRAGSPHRCHPVRAVGEVDAVPGGRDCIIRTAAFEVSFSGDYKRRQITIARTSTSGRPGRREDDWAGKECKKLAAWNRGIEESKAEQNGTDQKLARGPRVLGVKGGEARRAQRVRRRAAGQRSLAAKRAAARLQDPGPRPSNRESPSGQLRPDLFSHRLTAPRRAWAHSNLQNTQRLGQIRAGRP